MLRKRSIDGLGGFGGFRWFWFWWVWRGQRVAERVLNRRCAVPATFISDPCRPQLSEDGSPDGLRDRVGFLVSSEPNRPLRSKYRKLIQVEFPCYPGKQFSCDI